MSIQANTPGLDAQRARQNSGTTLLQDLAAKEKAKRDEAAQKAADNQTRAKENRDARKLQRELKQAEITGRVSRFVRDWATQNAAHVRAVNSGGQTINTAQLPSVGTLDLGTGKLVEGPLFPAPTSSITSPSESVGSSPSCIGLALYTKEESPEWEVWVSPGTVAGQVPEDFVPITGMLVAYSGARTVYAVVEIDEYTGEIVSTRIETQSNVPQDTIDTFYFPIGYYQYPTSGAPTVVNYGCGPVTAVICRNWFTAEPPYFGVTFSR